MNFFSTQRTQSEILEEQRKKYSELLTKMNQPQEQQKQQEIKYKKSIEMKSIETNESKKSIKTKIIKKQTEFFLNFLIDFNFLNTLIEFIESNELESQKISLRFLNSMISMNFFCLFYS